MKIIRMAAPKYAAKSIKLHQHLRKKINEEKFYDINEPGSSTARDNEEGPSELDNSIEILNGSFSKVRPIGESKEWTAPQASSTPKYELISDEDSEENNKDEQDMEYEENDLNITFNFQEDIVKEDQLSSEYMMQVEKFVQTSNSFLQLKQTRRDLLCKKLRKYKEKCVLFKKLLEKLTR